MPKRPRICRPRFQPSRSDRPLASSGFVSLLFAGDVLAGTGLLKSRLDVNHSKFPVFDFPVRGHGPEKSDPVAWHGNIRMVAAGHQHHITIAHRGYQFRILSVVLSQLKTASG